MEEHTVDIFYGGSFLNEKYRCEVVYLGGLKHEMVLNISNFVLSGLERSIQELVGNRKIMKVHFRKPKKPLYLGLMLLCEGTEYAFTDLLKKI